MQTVNHGAGSPMIMLQGVASWRSQPWWMNEKGCNLTDFFSEKETSQLQMLLNGFTLKPCLEWRCHKEPNKSFRVFRCHQTGLQGSPCPSPHLKTWSSLHHWLCLEVTHPFSEEDVEGRFMAGSLALWLVAPFALTWWAGWGWTQRKLASAAIQLQSPLGRGNPAAGSVLTATDCVYPRIFQLPAFGAALSGC